MPNWVMYIAGNRLECWEVAALGLCPRVRGRSPRRGRCQVFVVFAGGFDGEEGERCFPVAHETARSDEPPREASKSQADGVGASLLDVLFCLSFFFVFFVLLSLAA